MEDQPRLVAAQRRSLPRVGVAHAQWSPAAIGPCCLWPWNTTVRSQIVPLEPQRPSVRVEAREPGSGSSWP